MALQLFKEKLDGKYHGVAPATLLPKGWVSDGQNMRQVSQLGGWKARKGCDTHNTTQIAADIVWSLHRYEHPRVEDYHFLAQVDSKIYDATNDPPTVGTTFGTDVTNSQTISNTVPGFSDTIEGLWVYADGGVPLIWGGDTPYVTGFLCWDNSASQYSDFTKDVTDGRSSTEAIAMGAASDVWYVCSPEIAKGINLDLGGTVNATSRTATVSAWRSGSWTDVSATDGTASGGATMAVDGNLTWTAGADEMRVLGGVMGYWYRISFSGALSNSVDVVTAQVQFDLAAVTNKWDGVFETPLSVRFYDQSTTEYVDLSGKLTNESTSQYYNVDGATTSDFIYIKHNEPITGIGLGIVDDYENTANAQFDQIEYWDGDSWVAVTTNLTDETLDEGNDSSLAQSGVFWFDASAITPKRCTFEWDSLPGYWYRLSWDAAWDNADDDVRVYFVVVVPYPESLGNYNGVVEFKHRAVLWGDVQYPNRLRVSAKDRPDCFSGSDSAYTDAFGGLDKIVAAKRFYNELIVWKETSVWLMEGFAPFNFGNLKIADTVGCVAPKTAHVIEVGYEEIHKDEGMSIAIWCDADGVYVLDGRKPKKISAPVDQYFNPEFSTAVPAADLASLQAFVDKVNNEYHLLIPGTGSGLGTELVYNYINDTWYPPWSRTVGDGNSYLRCGLGLRGSNNRFYTYGGNSEGRVFLLETDTTDKDETDADVAITHQIKTRAIGADPRTSVTLDFAFRSAVIEAKAQSSGSITTNFYADLATSGTALTAPAAIALTNSGYNLVVDGVNASQERIKCFQLEFVAATADVELEIYSFLYEVDSRGEFSK
jgi:hypothetical protein